MADVAGREAAAAVHGQAPPPFSESERALTLRDACSTVGLESEGASLLRLGENALYRLASRPIVVRISRGEHLWPVAERQVAIARWLDRVGFPAVRLASGIEQPLLVRGHPVTFWELVTESSAKPTYGDLGDQLRRLHGLSPPYEYTLPPFPVFERASRRIAMAATVSESDRAFLRAREEELREQFAALVFPSPVVPVHGDAHVDNLMRAEDGRVVLIDFDSFSLSHPEWDLAVTATERLIGDRFVTAEQYELFVERYGFDIMGWAGFPVLRRIQEFRMTTWIMQNIGESRYIAEEFERRIASLRDEDAPRDWFPY